MVKAAPTSLSPNYGEIRVSSEDMLFNRTRQSLEANHLRTVKSLQKIPARIVAIVEQLRSLFGASAPISPASSRCVSMIACCRITLAA